MEAFKEAGKAAYEVLGLTEVREQIYKELGNSVEIIEDQTNRF